jgi:hypothetical protein
VRLAPQEVAQPGAQDLLVHGVGLDVLVVEALPGRPVGQPVERGRQPARAGRRRHLDHDELADGGAPQRAVQREQRHEVDRCQRGCRRPVDVRAVRVVEVQLAHHRGEQGGVHALGPAGAVLVVLHRDDRRLDLPLEARHDERLRVGLLEVVDGAVRDVLAQLPALAAVGQVPRRAGAADRLEQQRGEGGLDVVAAGGVPAQRVEEGPLELRAQAEHVGVPLERVVHARLRPVVQLVGQVERELEVVAVRVDVGARHGQAVGRAGAHERLQQRLAERPPGGRQRRSGGGGRGRREHGGHLSSLPAPGRGRSRG